MHAKWKCDDCHPEEDRHTTAKSGVAPRRGAVLPAALKGAVMMYDWPAISVPYQLVHAKLYSSPIIESAGGISWEELLQAPHGKQE